MLKPSETATAFTATMKLIAAFISNGLQRHSRKLHTVQFSPSEGGFRRRDEWSEYGFFHLQLADGPSATLVAGTGPSGHFSFDGSDSPIAKNVELNEIPELLTTLVEFMARELGLRKLSAN